MGGSALEKQSTSSAASTRPEFRRAHLATLFLLATRPLSTEEIVDQVYNSPVEIELGKQRLGLSSARKALKRDIDALKATGLVIEAVGKADDGQSLWQVNSEVSFTQGIALSEEDAVFLDIACLPLLDDPGFAQRDELRLALAKIDRLFDAAATGALTASAVRDPAVLVTMRDALNSRTAVDIAYEPRGSAETTRRVAPLGIFDLRSIIYIVCALIDGDGNLIPNSERTYRLDRIRTASRVERVAFDAPEDFDINQFRKLPFQIGPAQTPCSFSIPGCLLGPIVPELLGKGTLEPHGDGAVWTVDAADLGDAAAWAIAQGIRPLAPQELVDAWRTLLEEACHG